MIGTEFFYEDGKRKCRGWYTIEGDLITVRSAYGTQSTQLGGQRACRNTGANCYASWSGDHAEARRNEVPAK